MHQSEHIQGRDPSFNAIIDLSSNRPAFSKTAQTIDNTQARADAEPAGVRQAQADSESFSECTSKMSSSECERQQPQQQQQFADASSGASSGIHASSPPSSSTKTRAMAGKGAWQTATAIRAWVACHPPAAFVAATAAATGPGSPGRRAHSKDRQAGAEEQ